MQYKWFEPLRKAVEATLTPEEYQRWLTKVSQKHDCLVDKFFEEEAKKPIHEQVGHCMISCPCPNCSPGTL